MSPDAILYPGAVSSLPRGGAAIELDPTDDDKPPFFLPNRAAYRAASKPVKTRLRKATKWAHRMDSQPGAGRLAAMFRNLAEGAERDLDYLKEARS